jgi:hypothetical protein
VSLRNDLMVDNIRDQVDVIFGLMYVFYCKWINSGCTGFVAAHCFVRMVLTDCSEKEVLRSVLHFGPSMPPATV